MRLPRIPLLALVASVVVAEGCAGERTLGLAPTRETGGPRVVYDIEHRPLPDVPLPNDSATHLDPTSPTGRRVNVSLGADTRFERDFRGHFDKLDGFGVFAPITVSFDAPIDVKALKARHANDDFRDDAIFLINVDPSCSRFGEEIALDLGRGRFPVLLAEHGDPEASPQAQEDGGAGNRLFEFDPAGLYNQMLYEERNEDANGNGQLDPGEDLDDDGVLDEANLDDPKACDAFAVGSKERDRCVADHLLTFYERESNTLILRPVWPLEQRCQHAVYLTDRLTDPSGRAIESPFAAVNHRDQTGALSRGAPLLSRYGLSVDNVSFAWTFTTGSMTRTLETLRRGLYGAGPLARLASEFPVESAIELRGPSGTPGPFPGGCSGMVINAYWQLGIMEYGPNMCAFAADNTTIGSSIFGTFKAPNFLVDKTGNATPHYPNDASEVFDVDLDTGRATYGSSDVTFFCTLPPELDKSCSKGNPEGKPFCKPFPTTIYAHGYGSLRAEVTSYMGRQAQMGMAACAVDAPGHGGNVILQNEQAQMAQKMLEKYGSTGYSRWLLEGRDRDLNNDGVPDPGGDFYSASIFHTRDMLNQSALEMMQLVRIFRSFDGQRRRPDGSVLGDFDGDGSPDIGGAASPIGLWGISMGGLITGILGGAEPAADAIVPISGGAGLTDATVRSTVGGLPTMVFMPLLGPFVAGYRHDGEGKELPEGEIELRFLAGDVQNIARPAIGRLRGIAPGDRVEIVNLESGRSSHVTVSARGTFRVSVAADALDPLERRPLLVGPLSDEPITEAISFADTPRLGDRLAVRVIDGKTGQRKSVTDAESGKTLEQIDTFLRDLSFQGTRYPQGAPLVALQKGLGYKRNTPQFRRIVSILQNALDPVDAALWSTYYFEQHLDTSYDPNAYPGRNHTMVVPTAGDMVVPVNTAITTARTAGILGSWVRDESIAPEHGWRRLFVPDPRFGKSLDQHLIDTHVVENVLRLERHADKTLENRAVYDIDDLSDGRLETPCGNDDLNGGKFVCDGDNKGNFSPPRAGDGLGMRATHTRPDGSHDSLRIPYMLAHGQHGLWNAQRKRVWDADAHGVNLVSLYMLTRGAVTDLSPDCDCSATLTPTFKLKGKSVWFAPDDPCDNDEYVQIRVCNKQCAEALSMRTGKESTCQ